MDCILILGHSAYNLILASLSSVCARFLSSIILSAFISRARFHLAFDHLVIIFSVFILPILASYSALFCPTHHDLSFRIVFSSKTIVFLISFMVFSFLCAYFLPSYLHSQRSFSLFPPRPCPYYFCFKSVLIICQYSRGYSLAYGSVGRGTIPWQQFYFSRWTISLFSYNRHAEQEGLPPPSTVRLSDRLFSIVR